MDTYPIILPSVLGSFLGMKPGDTIKMTIGWENEQTNRMIVRAFVNQMPG